jgi:hypothetical protein
MKKSDLVVINLDRPRELRFGYKALKMLTAMNIDIDNMDTASFEFEDLEKIYFCGLQSDAKANGEVLKLEDVEDLLDLAPFKELVEKMQEAFKESFGEVPEVDEKNGQRVAKK